MAVVEDPENALHEEWMNECQEVYYDARKQYHTNKRNIEEGEELKGITRKRDVKYNSFLDSVKILEESMKEKHAAQSIRQEMISISKQFNDMKLMHLDLVGRYRSDDKTVTDWITTATSVYSKMNNQVEKYVKEVSLEIDKRHGLQLQKMPLPKFDGDVRRYARFKSDFLELVKPTLVGKQASFALRQCLSPDICKLVDSCEEDVDSMIARLDEKFGDPSKLVDVIVSKIIKFRRIENNEDKRLIEFVEVIEAGYRDLKSINLGRDLSNANIVSIIENKLPRSLALEWFREIHKENSKVVKSEKFPYLLEFLSVEKKSLEYGLSELRTPYEKTSGKVYMAEGEVKPEGKCLIHGEDTHKTGECKRYLNMNVKERYGVLAEKSACFKCLEVGHFAVDCKDKEGCVEGCNRWHHRSLHSEERIAKKSYFATNNGGFGDIHSCVLQIMAIKITTDRNSYVNVLWDGGSTVSLVTKEKAMLYGLKGSPVKLSLTTCGGEEKEIESYRYTIPLIDTMGHRFDIRAYGIERITSDICSVNIGNVIHLFKDISVEDLERPSGSVDLLIGLEYAAWHPRREQESGHLLVLQNQFGRCLGGSHPLLEEKTKRSIMQVTVNNVSLSKFFEIESMGIQTTPLCGNCRCGECPVGSKKYTIKEERELDLIKQNLVFRGDHWEVTYPWKRKPQDLPDNRAVALKRLVQTEKRLAKDERWADIYCEQMEDMVSRGISRKISEAEIREYKGPIHYIAHHAVVNQESKSTPVRIVFNSSAIYRGHSLNDYWAKGPNAFINPLLGMLVRFREQHCAMVADIRKMYNSVSISLLDQHCHRYLWREMMVERKPDTYVITAVNLGDKPGGAIATVALRETAKMYEAQYPEAAEVIEGSTYVDDIIDSVHDQMGAVRLAKQISLILKKGNFHIKGWRLSGGESLDMDGNIIQSDHQGFVNVGSGDEVEKVLGIRWEPVKDVFKFVVRKGNHTKGKNVDENWTKRKLISFVNGIYDPMGLVAPVITRGKMMIRMAWAHEPKLGWDDLFPEDINTRCMEFVKDMFHLEEISFRRCIRPKNAVGNPILVSFSDASREIFGACCYLQWKTIQGSYICSLIMGKSRVAPLKVITIVRLELSAAVMAVRMRKYILKEGRIHVDRFVHIVDSEIVRTMIQKESYGFNTFTATRVGEIQENSDPGEWYWVSGKMNIADLITRGARPEEIDVDTNWQKGPSFAYMKIEEWPISQACYTKDLPERNEVCLSLEVSSHPKAVIDINRFSKYLRLIYCTARILSIKDSGKFSLRNVGKDVMKERFDDAVQFWIIEAQREIKDELLKGIEGRGRFRKLCPLMRDDGVYVVGGRAWRWTEVSYNKKMLPILPKKHRFAQLFTRYIHEKAHLGVDADVAKVRTSYWVIGITQLMKSIRQRCVTCRKKYMKLIDQRMGRLPIERLKPAPPWYHAMIDLFGPFMVRGEVNKRSSMKVYGVIITDLLTRAVHVDIASNYSTDAFLMVFRKFVSIRGYPSVVFSDKGSQLTGASSELKLMHEAWNWKEVTGFGVSQGLEWKFSPSDSPWWNGCVESLVRSVKKAMYFAIGEQRLSFSELQTVCYEAANIVNERPIGIKPNECSDTTYLCPNDMLLGRSTIKVPDGSFDKKNNLSRRYLFVQLLAESFWRKWTNAYFPSLIIQQKWHCTKRNVKVGDVVVISDKNLARNKWRIGKVSEAIAGDDAIVRRIKIEYKNHEKGEFVTVERAVQRVNVILPVEECCE